eukprot:TRINITY_DN602_c0_g2_i6.p1 TRINITY_DN602_c0_g2~~TRINITY_DN602_c0_g2_i6.p1  ORF type:complete len:236 (+),score=3.54 TRINITY_DN602_c0_g2_i6:50-757(+)
MQSLNMSRGIGFDAPIAQHTKSVKESFPILAILFLAASKQIQAALLAALHPTFWSSAAERLAVAETKSRFASETLHRLTLPDDGDNLAELRAKAPFMRRRLSMSSPYFRSTEGSTGYGKVIFSVLGYMCICALIVTFITSLWSLERWPTPLTCATVVSLAFYLVGSFWEVRCNCGRVKRDKMIELIGSSDDMKYADIYFGKTYEIVCHREIDQNQLMLLVAAAIKGRYFIYSTVP